MQDETCVLASCTCPFRMKRRGNRKLRVFETIKKLYQFTRDRLSGGRVVFHHVPKCGGTSVHRALRFRYALSYEYVDLLAAKDAIAMGMPSGDADELLYQSHIFRELTLLYQLNRGVHCVVGHVPFSSVAFNNFSDDYSFITILRDPVSFFESFYFYNLESNVGEWRIDSSLEEFIQSTRAAEIGRFYSDFFCDLTRHRGIQAGDSIRLAKKNLEKFTLVGMTENMQLFQQRLQEALGVKLRIGHENRSSFVSGERQQLSNPIIRKKIEAISGPNIEIYEYARSTLAK